MKSWKSSPKYVESTLTKFLRNTAIYDKIYGRIEDNEQVVRIDDEFEDNEPEDNAQDNGEDVSDEQSEAP